MRLPSSSVVVALTTSKSTLKPTKRPSKPFKNSLEMSHPSLTSRLAFHLRFQSRQTRDQVPNENGFLYDALPKSTHIRLLKLQVEEQFLPETPDQNIRQDLRGSLKTFDLAKVPKYWALSYTWGDPERADDIDRRLRNLADPDPLSSNRIILIGSVEFAVTENLQNALIQIRNHCAFHLRNNSAEGNQRLLRPESRKGLCFFGLIQFVSIKLIWLRRVLKSIS